MKFDRNKSCDDTLKRKILAAFQNDYVEGVDNGNVGFAQTTTLELLNNLYESYGTITPIKMEDATNAMVTPYDPSKLIFIYFLFYF